MLGVWRQLHVAWGELARIDGVLMWSARPNGPHTAARAVEYGTHRLETRSELDRGERGRDHDESLEARGCIAAQSRRTHSDTCGTR